MACSWDREANIANAEKLIREAAKQGANIVLIQELFETPYFCIEQDSRHLRIATSVDDNLAIKHFQQSRLLHERRFAGWRLVGAVESHGRRTEGWPDRRRNELRMDR